MPSDPYVLLLISLAVELSSLIIMVRRLASEEGEGLRVSNTASQAFSKPQANASRAWISGQ